MLQDGAAGEWGPAGGGPSRQQILVHSPPGIQRDRSSATFDAC